MGKVRDFFDDDDLTSYWDILLPPRPTPMAPNKAKRARPAPRVDMFSHVTVLRNPPRPGFVVDVYERLMGRRPLKLRIIMLDLPDGQIELVWVRRSQVAPLG